jgi:hypothetical protein
MFPPLGPHFYFFLAVAINSSNEANKAGRYALLSSLYYLDVYACTYPELSPQSKIVCGLTKRSASICGTS